MTHRGSGRFCAATRLRPLAARRARTAESPNRLLLAVHQLKMKLGSMSQAERRPFFSVLLARAAGVSISTVKRFEDGSVQNVSDHAAARLQDAAETEGVRFLADDGNGVGVRFRRR